MTIRVSLSDSIPKPEPLVEPLHYTRKEAAQMLRICVRKLDQLTKNGEIRCVRIGRAVRYSRADLLAFIQRMTTN